MALLRNRLMSPNTPSLPYSPFTAGDSLRTPGGGDWRGSGDWLGSTSSLSLQGLAEERCVIINHTLTAAYAGNCRDIMLTRTIMYLYICI